LRDYLYIALGGNRKGPARRQINLAVTMILGGLWHGASWSFVLWGTLHGVYLILNHGIRACTQRLGWQSRLDRSRIYALIGWALTFFLTVLACVFFRAETLPGAMRMLSSMLGQMPSSVDAGHLLGNAGLQPNTAIGWCLGLSAIAHWLPNSNRIGEQLLLQLEARPWLRPAVGGAAFMAMVFLIVINGARSTASAFIYFNF